MKEHGEAESLKLKEPVGAVLSLELAPVERDDNQHQHHLRNANFNGIVVVLNINGIDSRVVFHTPFI